MHEYSVVASLVERVEQEAAQRGARAVERIHVRVGDLAGVDATLLATAFETFAPATGCAGAELLIERAPGDDLLLTRIEMEVPDVS